LLMAETVTVNLPAHEVYRLLVDYFKRERMRVKYSVEPSLIEVAAGSLLGSPHDVKTEIAPENGKTLTEFRFDFAKTYAGMLLALMICLVILGLLFGPIGIALMLVGAAMTAIGAPRKTHALEKSFIDKVTSYLSNAEKAERQTK